MSIAIVTGASSGIGSELVRLLGEYTEVEEIWAIARRENRLRELKAAGGIPVRPVPMDLADTTCFYRLAEMILAENK